MRSFPRSVARISMSCSRVLDEVFFFSVYRWCWVEMKRLEEMWGCIDVGWGESCCSSAIIPACPTMYQARTQRFHSRRSKRLLSREKPPKGLTSLKFLRIGQWSLGRHSRWVPQWYNRCLLGVTCLISVIFFNTNFSTIELCDDVGYPNEIFTVLFSKIFLCPSFCIAQPVSNNLL